MYIFIYIYFIKICPILSFFQKLPKNPLFKPKIAIILTKVRISVNICSKYVLNTYKHIARKEKNEGIRKS